MSHYKKLAKDTLIYGMGTIVPKFLNFAVYTPYFTYNDRLNQAEYGLNSEIYAYVFLFMILLTYGTETAYFKFSSRKDYKEKSVFNNILSSLLVSSSLFLILVFTFSGDIKSFINFGGNEIHIKLFGIIIFFDVLCTIPFAKLRNERKIIRFSIVRIINVLLNICFLVVGLSLIPLFKDKIDFLNNPFFEDKIALILASNLTASFITFLILSRELKEFKFVLKKKIIIPVLIYASPLLVSGIAGAINESLDKIIMRFLLPEDGGYSTLGIYSASYRLAVILSIFNQMFRFASEPYFFSISDEKDSKSVYANTLKYFLIFSLLIFLCVNFYIEFFKFYLGENFREGLYILPIVLFSNVLTGVLININFWFKVASKTQWAIIIVGCGACITVIANIVLVPVIGISGSAWSHVIANLTMVFMSLFLGRKFYRINYDYRSLIFYVILTGVIFALGYLIEFKYSWIKTIYVTMLIAIYIYRIEKKENLINTLFRK